MEFFELFGFLTIILESIKLLAKNGKLMSFIAIILVFLLSCLFLFFSYFVQFLALDISMVVVKSLLPNPADLSEPSDPTSNSFSPNIGFFPTQLMSKMDHLKLDFALVLALQIAFILVFSIIFFFAVLATTLVSAMSYGGITLSMKELVLRIGNTWKKPLITILYVLGLGLGYFTFVIFLSSPLLILYTNSVVVLVLVLIGVTSFVLYLYMAVTWTLSIVISIVEESSYGAKALGKATALAKGKRLHGFMLDLCFNLVVLMFYVCYTRLTLSLKNAVVFGLVVLNVSSLVKIFGCVAYVVLYFRCKKHHGEEIELQGMIQYAKLPTALLPNAMP